MQMGCVVYEVGAEPLCVAYMKVLHQIVETKIVERNKARVLCLVLSFQKYETKIVEKNEAHVLCAVLSVQKLYGFRGTQTAVTEHARLYMLCIYVITFLMSLDLTVIIVVMLRVVVSAVSPTGGVPSSPPHPPSPPHISAGRPPSISLDMLDAEALITVEIVLVSANCPSNEGSREALQIVSVQFNNLDIIGIT